MVAGAKSELAMIVQTDRVQGCGLPPTIDLDCERMIAAICTPTLGATVPYCVESPGSDQPSK